MSTPTALMPAPMAQFFDQNGAVLAGGMIYTYQAGTTTPQAAYTDSTGNTALPNPVVLDASGRASVWLSSANYKIVATDANGVQQWSIDNVSAVSQAELQGTNTFATLGVTGNLSVGGNVVVTGSLTAASGSITGALSVAGTATLASAVVSGNETVGGTLGVTGAATFSGGETVTGGLSADAITVGGVSLSTFVTNLIPALTALSGALVISGVATSGSWVIFTFGTVVGTRIRIAVGAGTLSNGASITLPSGFSAANAYFGVSINNVNSTPGNNLDGITASLSSLTIVATGNDNSGHTFAGTANWFGVVYQLSY